MARVSNIFIAVERRKAMQPVEEALAVTDRGLQGCLHGRPGSRRQVLLMDIETLSEFALLPGTIRENITTSGLNPAELRPGQRLYAGEAMLEVTIPCEPCDRMDEIRMGLQKELENRRGILCRVIEGGRIRRGDAIEILSGSPMPPMEERVEQERRN